MSLRWLKLDFSQGEVVIHKDDITLCEQRFRIRKIGISSIFRQLDKHKEAYLHC